MAVKEKLPFIKRKTGIGQVSGRVFPVKKRPKSQTIVEAIKARFKELREKRKKKNND